MFNRLILSYIIPIFCLLQGCFNNSGGIIDEGDIGDGKRYEAIIDRETGLKKIKVYYPTGELYSIFYFNSYEEKVGEHISYYKSRKVKQKSFYKRGKEHGIVEFFYENGNIESSTTYRNGIVEGWHKYFNEDGHLEAINYKHKGESTYIKQFKSNGNKVDTIEVYIPSVKLNRDTFLVGDTLDATFLVALPKTVAHPKLRLVCGVYLKNGSESLGISDYPFEKELKNNNCRIQGVLTKEGVNQVIGHLYRKEHGKVFNYPTFTKDFFVAPKPN